MKTMKSYFVRIPAFYFILLSSLFSIVFNAQSTQGFSNSFFTNNLQLSPLKTDISSCSLRHFRQRWRHSSTKLWLSQENPVYKKGGYEKGSSRNSTEATKSRASSFQNSNTTSATPLTISGTYSNDSSSLMMDGATQVGILSSEERERLLKEVEELRERARQLRAEANREEAALTESRSSLKSQKNSEADDIIDRLFHNVGLTSADSTIAATVEKRISDIMRTERWSPEQVVMVLERLHERQMQVQDQPPIMTPSQAAVNRPADFQIGDTRNAAKAANETEWNVLDGCISSLINAASVLDDEYNDRANAIKGSGGTQMPPDKILQVNTSWTGRVASELKARRKELIRAEQEELKRKIAANVNAVVNAGNAAADATGIAAAENIQEYTRQSLALGSYEDEKQVGKPKKELNISRVMERVAMVPLWVPTPLLPYLVSSKATLRKEDVTTIKEKVLVGSRFFCTSSDAIPSAAIFRGNIRTSVGLVDVDTSTRTQSQERNRTAVVFEEIQQRLEAQGLSDRIQLFMMEDPEWRPGKDSRTPKAPAVILAIAKAVQPTETVMEKTTTSVVAKRTSIALTFLTSFGFSISSFALNPVFFDSIVNQKDISILSNCIPLGLGLLTVQVCHEAAHYIVAKLRNIKIGRPTPLPSPQLGTFGCITPILSFPPNRAALFDFAFSGPVMGMAASLLMMVGGIHLTTHATDIVLSRFPVLPVGIFKSSLLTGMLLSWFAPKTMMLPLAQPLPLHPLFLSGFVGLISSALNLLPIFRLDGGRIAYSVFGHRFLGIASATSLLFMLSLTMSGTSSIALTWGLLVTVLQRRTEVPVRDDVTPVDDFRLGAWVASLTMSLLALAPFPGGPGFL